jgi:hypothetical protein
MARPRSWMCGDDALNLYQDVSGPGFVEFWDALAVKGS